MITFFATLKPFEGLAGVIQKNAIMSWTKLWPKCEIILLGKEKGVEEISQELGLVHIPAISYEKYGKPILAELFEKAESSASNKFMCYVNGDIILTNDFIRAFEYLMPLKQKWLMVGRRRNIILEKECNFDDPHTIDELKEIAIKENRMSSHKWIDYFLYTKGMFANIPPFVIGCWRWDNWLIDKALSQRAVVIDATDVVTAIHQDHDPSGYEKTKYVKRKEACYIENDRLFKKTFIGNYGSIDHATYVLTSSGLQRKKTGLRKSFLQFIRYEPYRRTYMKIPCRIIYAIYKMYCKAHHQFILHGKIIP